MVSTNKSEKISIFDGETIIELTGVNKEAFIADRQATADAQALLEAEYKAKQDLRESAIRQLAQTANLTEEQITLLIQGI
jgi:hypothetical protein